MTGIELLVGGWFASPIIRRVLEKAQKYLGANYELQKNTHEVLETLTRTLVLCQATVEEAEKRMINNSNLTTWLKMLKEAVYDADDVLDDMDANSIKEKTQGKNKVREFASSSLFGLKDMFLPDPSHRNLKRVLDKMVKISDEIPKFVDLVRMNENYGPCNFELSDLRETISLSPEEVGLYGRQEELDLILEIILGPGSGSSKKGGQHYNTYSGLFVIPIVGMGGVGKTALAQAVYNNPEVQQTFETKIWISVSYNLDVLGVMRKINQSFGGYVRVDVNTLEDISRSISSTIAGVRFLVVLDDLFEKIEYKWDIIYTTLSHGPPGSIVLITTQNQAFANRVATLCPIALNPLEWDIFWELFKHFAFGNVVITEEKRDNLEQIGTKIANKLHGLPLAAKIIGKILRCNIDEDKWRRISRSEWWEIPEGKSQILPAIAVGYQQLDPCLRQCFAYCSVFPRNSLLDKDRLVQMWIAQNFIHHHNSNDARKMEDIGREWFDKLVEKSFFKLAGDYNGYVIPNLMYDLAVIVSSDDCFYLTDQSNEIPQGVRHLAVDTKNLNVLQQIPERNHIRSFFYFGFPHVDGMLSTINKILCNMKSIRVLDLSYLHMGTTEPSKAIQNNILGVLDFSCLHMETKEPPKAIQNLTHLRFLDLSSTGITELSHSFLDDHYHLQSLHIRQPKLTREPQLVKLPRGINKLINLRHLDADADTIAQISGIGQVVDLQELDEYRVGGTEGHKIVGFALKSKE